jgi:hypothetical protein
MTRGWRKLHNEELHNFYSSPSIIRMDKSRRMRWAGHVARMGEKRNAYRILMGNPEALRRSRRKWEDNIKMYLSGIEWSGMDWIVRAPDGDTEHGNEPSGFAKCWEIPWSWLVSSISKLYSVG